MSGPPRNGVCRRRCWAAMATVAALLAASAGCGQKGPLLLPAGAAAPAGTPAVPDAEERDADEGRDDE